MFEGRPDRSAEIVLLGRSNVGKSTLMRELTGHAIETGKRPGVTQSPNYYDWAGPDVVLTDLPGFGFMAGVEETHREKIKTAIVRYLENHKDVILVGILVLDANSAIEIIDRHRDRGDLPHDVEMFRLLEDLNIPAIVAVNKIDKVDDRDATLDGIADRLGLVPPWQQWQDTIAPISAKRGSITALESALRTHLHASHRDDIIGLVC